MQRVATNPFNTASGAGRCLGVLDGASGFGGCAESDRLVEPRAQARGHGWLIRIRSRVAVHR